MVRMGTMTGMLAGSLAQTQVVLNAAYLAALERASVDGTWKGPIGFAPERLFVSEQEISASIILGKTEEQEFRLGCMPLNAFFCMATGSRQEDQSKLCITLLQLPYHRRSCTSDNERR